MTVLAITLLAGALGAWRLGAESIWFDEAYSIVFTDRGFGAMFDLLREGRESNMSLYYVVLKLWRGAVGDSAAELRLLSVIATMATIPVLFALARRLVDERVAILAAVLYAINGFVLEHSQTARGYTLAALLVTLAAYGLVRAVDDDHLVWWALVVAAATAAVHVHYFALPAVAALFVSLVLLPRGRVKMTSVVASAATVLVLCAPTLLVALSAGSREFEGTTPAFVSSLVAALAGGGGFVLAIAVGLAATSAAVGWFVSARRVGRSEATWRGGFALCWLVLPSAALLVVGVLQPVLALRFFFVLVPALSIVVATGLMRLPSRRMQVAGAIALVALSSLGALRWHESDPRQDWQRALDVMLEEGGGADDAVVLYSPNGQIPYEVNLDQLPSGERVGEVIYPPPSWDPLPLGEDWPAPESILEARAHDEGVWFVAWDDNGARGPEIDRIVRLLEIGYDEVPVPAISGVDLRRFVPSEDG